jgi:hypothetical protein
MLFITYEDKIIPIIVISYKNIIKACKNGNLTVVKHLIKSQTNVYFNKLMYCALTNGHLSIVKYLFSIGYDKITDEEIYSWPSFYGHLDIIKYLISQEIILEKKANINWSSRCGHLNVVKYLFYLYDVDSQIIDDSIIWSSLNGHLDIVKYLVSKGGNVTIDDNLPIAMAFKTGQTRVIKYLFSQGANNIKVKNNDKESKRFLYSLTIKDKIFSI